MSHVVLLGDSIFDNRAYVAPEPDVVHQLRSRLGSGWSATLLAVDGHVTEDVVARQLDRLPDDASHLVISVGGNTRLIVLSISTSRRAWSPKQSAVSRRRSRPSRKAMPEW